ncbi:MAG: serine protease [Flavobacteriales bacterium]|jgi:serine protease
MKQVLLAVLFVAACFINNAQETPFISGELLVQMESGQTAEFLIADLTSSHAQLHSMKIMRCVNRPMNIWQLSFDQEDVNNYELKRLVSLQKGVSNVQFNHLVSERSTTPDDSNFDEQWHHLQSSDKDIDTDLAWDITTGGQTFFGDDIVVCVIEGGGSDWNHVDLIDNHWVNTYEIPNNNVDDDNNGFVDDFNGWDPQDEDDDVGAGNHGTKVSSMIGSTGNNGIGVAGVNWDVDIMQVGIGSLNEANVLAAYEYPLVMRQMYNASGGSEGAFVVATNASWGIDNGQPADAPLWCAVYDTLGVHGVLNCGATANNNVNIDVVGDLPTGCGSDYMISVTATDVNDVRTFSGYGATTIDLAAPGASVYMAENTNSYGNSSGTSFASPCVAGIIALMYSAPCPSFSALVYASPQESANYVRQALFDGVDPVDNLSDECVTGGRANANNSLMLIMDECSFNECFTPFALVVNAAGQDDYTISWGATDAMILFDLRYRIVGSDTWTEVSELTATEYLLLNQTWCTTYEVQVLAYCDDDTQSDWSASVEWTTNGCCVAPNPSSFSLESVFATSALVGWEDILAAETYDIEVSESGAGVWSDYGSYSDPEAEITPLDSCNNYDLRVKSVCAAEESDFSEIFSFNTPGCGSCSSIEYCEVTGDGSQEWIARVVLNSIDNESGSDAGYGDYTSISTELNPGGAYTITLEPGFSTGSAWTEYFMVWIDYNANGEFEDNEVAYDPGETTTVAISGTINVPLDAYPGSIRMRVAMDYQGTIGGGNNPTPCDPLAYGEFEDYCIHMSDEVSVEEASIDAFTIFPNPASDQLTIKWSESTKLKSAAILDLRGKVIFNKDQPYGQMSVLDLSNFADGVYFIRLVDENDFVTTKQVVVQKK